MAIYGGAELQDALNLVQTKWMFKANAIGAHRFIVSASLPEA